MPLKMWSVTSFVLTSPLSLAGFAGPLLLFVIRFISLLRARCYAEAFIKGCGTLCAREAELRDVSHCCIPLPGHAASHGLCWAISLTPQTKCGLGPVTQPLRSP